MVVLPSGGTVGGALAVGQSEYTRLGFGPLRDVLLQAQCIDAAGRVIRVGGPTVKNVSGFDMCRLLVGSYGTLMFIGTVILRTRPLPRNTAWFHTDSNPFALMPELYRPVALLWNGTTTHVRLDGHIDDVRSAAERCKLVGTSGPPSFPKTQDPMVNPSGRNCRPRSPGRGVIPGRGGGRNRTPLASAARSNRRCGRRGSQRESSESIRSSTSFEPGVQIRCALGGDEWTTKATDEAARIMTNRTNWSILTKGTGSLPGPG